MGRTYFPPTTAQQRKLLFETWEKTGNVSAACRKAHVCRQTFYTWLPRFQEEGYAGLEEPRSHAPHNPRGVSVEVEKRGVEMKQVHPEWGKRRIADELAKANSWVPLVSPNTVRRILRDAGLWAEDTTKPAKKGAKAMSGTPKPPAKP